MRYGKVGEIRWCVLRKTWWVNRKCCNSQLPNPTAWHDKTPFKRVKANKLYIHTTFRPSSMLHLQELLILLAHLWWERATPSWLSQSSTSCYAETPCHYAAFRTSPVWCFTSAAGASRKLGKNGGKPTPYLVWLGLMAFLRGISLAASFGSSFLAWNHHIPMRPAPY